MYGSELPLERGKGLNWSRIKGGAKLRRSLSRPVKGVTEGAQKAFWPATRSSTYRSRSLMVLTTTWTLRNVAFKIAGSMVFKKRAARKLMALEPIMKVQVIAPPDFWAM